MGGISLLHGATLAVALLVFLRGIFETGGRLGARRHPDRKGGMDMMKTNDAISQGMTRAPLSKSSVQYLALLSSKNWLIDSTDKWGVPITKKCTRKIAGYRIDKPLVPWMFKFIQNTDAIDKVLEDIRNGTAIAVGDGSYFEIYNICTGAWVISSADGSQWIKGGGVVPGLNRDKNSYRGEVASLTGIANCLVALTPSLGCATSSIVVASDNDKAVDSLWWKRDYVKSSMKSIDLITSNIDLWERSLVKPRPTRVKGHADELHRPLTFLEHLNTKVDYWAKEIAVRERSRPVEQDLNRDIGLGLLCIGKDVIVSNLNFSMQDCLEKRQIHQYLSDLLEIPEDAIRSQINWTCVERARRSRTFKQNRFITKVLANDLPVGSVLQRRNHAKQATCPCCKVEDEDLMHFLTCLEHEDILTSLLEELEIHMQKVDTHPQIVEFILCGLSSWFKDPEKGAIDFCPDPDFLQIAVAQNGLGWFGTLMGFFHKSLILYQHDHYTRAKSRRTGIAWGKQMTCKMWDMVYKLWTYRNSCLHDTSTADEMRGLDELEDAIVVEHRRGLRTLDGRRYGKFFRRNLDKLLRDTTQKKKAWFLLIRSARELDDDTPLDNFTHDDLLREWVGLTPIGVT